MMLAQLERNVDRATGLFCAGKLAGGEYVRQSGGMTRSAVMHSPVALALMKFEGFG